MAKRAVKQATTQVKKRQRLQNDKSEPSTGLVDTSNGGPVNQIPNAGLNPSGTRLGDATAEHSNTNISSAVSNGNDSQHAATEWRTKANGHCQTWLEEHDHEISTASMRREFKGWVELEADPDYFTVMLERMGIQRTKVVEIHSMDEMLSNHHCLKYGIIFLSRYHDDSLDCCDQDHQPDLWFCNQTIDNACATVAILNIVNNVSTLDIGENLGSFRSFSKTLDPVMKGEALAGFDWCRTIHNSLAKRTEMLVASSALEQEARSKSKTSKSRTTRRGKRRRTAQVVESDTANHYIAYVPFSGNLWKLDGLARRPRNMGPLANGEAWIHSVHDDIQKRMSVLHDDSSAGYTLLAIVEDKTPALIDMLGRIVNLLSWLEYCISEKRDYFNKSVSTAPEDNTWLPGREPVRGPLEDLGLTQSILNKEGVRLISKQKSDIAASSEEHLNWIRLDIVEEQLKLRELILPLKVEREEQWAKYKDGMFDYGPVIHQWVGFLQKNKTLGPLVDWHINNEGMTD